MSSIYQEALLDAQKIRETAEDAARDKIMESITPQIREMINSRILFEQPEFEGEDDAEDFETTFDVEDDLDFDSIVDSMPDVDVGVQDQAATSAAEKAASSVAVYASGDVNINVSEDDDDENLVLDESGSDAFARLVSRDFVASRNLDRKITRLQERVRKLRDLWSAINERVLTPKQKERLELSFISCVKDGLSLQREAILSGRGSQRLEEKLISIIKEMREMSSKYKRNIFDFLFEADAETGKDKMKRLAELGMYEQDEDVVDDEAVDVDTEEAAGEVVEVPVDPVTAALEDLGSALELDVVVGGAEEEAEEAVEEEEFDLNLEEAADAGAEETYEIDESTLRRELSRMKRSRKSRKLREQEEADPMADQFGAGEVVGDVIEVDEDDLINVLADELGDVSKPTVESRRRRSASRRRPARGSNRVARKAMREAAVYKRATTKLKGQLVEMNLFNAKLLYANKLLQNKNLTVKQQRAIVEALDNAKTLREAKLLYKSLSESLARRGRGGKNLSESTIRTIGSSSRSTRSAAPTRNGNETDRWAVLAGISKN